jgi:hypothetical protein
LTHTLLLPRETTEAFIAAMVPVFNKILECYALGLGFPEDFFREVRGAHVPSHHAHAQHDSTFLLAGAAQAQPRFRTSACAAGFERELLRLPTSAGMGRACMQDVGQEDSCGLRLTRLKAA